MAEAEAKKAEAKIKAQLALIETEVAKQAERRQRAMAELAKQEAITAAYDSRLTSYGR